MADYYDRQGRPLDLMTFAARFENPQAKRVLGDEIDGLRISTVRLGINHQFSDGPPLIFETMVFGEGPWADFQQRYSTEAEAIDGHREIVALIRGGESPPDIE